MLISLSIYTGIFIVELIVLLLNKAFIFTSVQEHFIGDQDEMAQPTASAVLTQRRMNSIGTSTATQANRTSLKRDTQAGRTSLKDTQASRTSLKETRKPAG